jgi:hypothetical protein
VLSVRSPVAEIVHDVARSIDRDDWQTFRLLLELSYCALAQRGPGTGQTRDELEARYMRAVYPYRDHGARFKFPEFLGQVGALVHRQCDPLGEAAGELGLLSKHLGQVFTPYSVARLNAEMIMRGLGYFIEEQGYCTLAEPTCGAGCLVLAAADVVEADEHELCTSMLVQATDLSEHCYQMAYVQLAMRGVAGIVRWGNSLSDEVFEWAWLPATSLFYERHGTLFDRTPSPRHRARPPRHRTRSVA